MKWALIVLNVIVGVLFAGMVAWCLWGDPSGGDIETFFWGTQSQTEIYAMSSALGVPPESIGVIGGSDGPTTLYITANPVGRALVVVLVVLPFANAIMLYRLGRIREA